MAKDAEKGLFGGRTPPGNLAGDVPPAEFARVVAGFARVATPDKDGTLD